MKPYNEEQSKKEQVEQMFDNIAPTYDRLNHVLSFNIDRIWRRRVMRIVRRCHPAVVMDIATGTGDLAIAMAKRIDDVCIKGECIEWLVDNHPELVSDEVYDDFDDSGRWSIGKAYILALDEGFFRCWEEVGLTEMQPNEWWDQTCEPVHMKEVTISTWVTDEEDY